MSLIDAMQDHQRRKDELHGQNVPAHDPEAFTSYSAMNAHRACPQRWVFGRLRRLEKDSDSGVSVESALGSWWHAARAADAIRRGRDLGSLRYVPAELTTFTGGPVIPVTDETGFVQVFEAAMLWWSRQSEEAVATWLDRIGDTLPNRLFGLNDAWGREWAEETEKERPLAVEMPWERALPMPEGAAPVTLRGFIDEVYEDTEHHIIVTRDSKTSKKLETQTSADDMSDSQLSLYTWGAAPIVQGWGIGRLGATAYDRVRSVKPTTPVLTAAGALSKSVTDYDYLTYQAWSRGPDGQGVRWGTEGEYTKPRTGEPKPKFGVYMEDPKVTEKLLTPVERSKWFQRTLTPLNANLIRAHVQAAIDSAQDMQRTAERFREHGSGQRNVVRENCNYRCDFTELCRAEMFGGPKGTYDIREFGLRERK